MIQNTIIGTIVGFEEVITQKGDPLQAIHVKTGSNSIIIIWFNAQNIFFNRFGRNDEGKRYNFVVEERGNGSGGIKYTLIQYAGIDQADKTVE